MTELNLKRLRFFQNRSRPLLRAGLHSKRQPDTRHITNGRGGLSAATRLERRSIDSIMDAHRRSAEFINQWRGLLVSTVPAVNEALAANSPEHRP
jgi:hypothetical protein